jgi:putative ABC transport system permease protein
VLPDERRFGVLWMNQEELAAAFDMEGAFNDVSLTLMHGATEAEVIARLDRLIEPYGGLGAYAREDQVSHEFVANEIRELRGTAQIVPLIFLTVAAFLLNVVLARLISTQREQIAALKAVGYSRFEIGLHYLRIVLLIVLVSVAIGTVAGAWMGKGLTILYSQFFHFPIFEYGLPVAHVLAALVVSGFAGLAGTLMAVRRAAALPPAEAMQPLPPADFRPTLLERSGLQRLLTPAARMILRQIERRPAKALMSGVGISLATAILVVGDYVGDAIDYGVEYEFHTVQRFDLTVVFNEPRSSSAVAAVNGLPGVRHSEPFRAIATRLRAGHRSRRVGIMGIRTDGELYRPREMHGGSVELPPEGLVLSVKLGELLGVGVGDEVTVEVLQEGRPVRRMAVSGLVEDFAGTNAFLSFEAANRLMDQEGVMSGMFVAAEPAAIDELFSTLKRTPVVAGVAVKQATLDSFFETIAKSMLLMRTFNVVFAGIIACGVVYNSARISLSERSRELATLRVIGFTRGEISLIQLGELGLLVLVFVPAGLGLGYGLAALSSSAFDTELFRIPFVVDRSTLGFAATVVVLAAAASGLVVRRMIDRLDLVAVLKTRD